MTWHIKEVHKQVQSKTYKAQGALTSASTTNKHKLKQHQKRLIKEVKSTLESDHLYLVNELESTMVTGSELQAFMTRSLKIALVWESVRFYTDSSDLLSET